GLANATPRQPHVGIAIGVDPDRSGLRLLRETLYPSDVAAPDAGREAVGRAVGDAERFGFIFELDDAHHGPEDFFLRDAHLVLDVGKHGGADEIAAVADALAARRQPRAFLAADIHVIEDALHLLLGDDRPHRRGAIGGIADADGPGALRQPLDHFVIDLLVGQHARAGRADLPGVEEDSPRRRLAGRLAIGLVEDDV